MASVFKTRVNSPSGPKGHFITGNFPDYGRDQLGFLTHCARQYGDVVRLRFGPFPTYLLNHPDLIEQVLVAQNSKFMKPRGLRMNRWLLGNGLLTSEGDFWRRQRRLVQPAFHHQRIAGYGDVMVTYTDRMLNNWQDGEIIDVHEQMMRLTLAIVAKTLYDADVVNEVEEVGDVMAMALQRFSDQIGNMFLFMLPDNVPTPGNLLIRKALKRLDQILCGIIQQRRDSGKDTGDLLSMLLQAQADDGTCMSDQQLLDEVKTLFVAGHETTANALSWTWYLLAQHPKVEAKLVVELQAVLGGRIPDITDLPQLRYTESVVMESMRLYPPAWLVAREALHECEVGEYLLPAGATVFMSQWVVHRDPRFFGDPEAFKPERWLDNLAKRLPAYAYFPFGGGPRLCVARSFAFMEIILIVATIAQKFRLTLRSEHPIVPQPSITLRPKHGIKVSLTKR